jgi:uncharacterized protein with PQ loop repeat
MNLGNLLIVLAGLIWAIELIPQIHRTIRTKSVEDISLSFFVLCAFAYVAYLFGNAILKNWVIFFAHVPSLIMNLIMVILIIVYRKREV